MRRPHESGPGPFVADQLPSGASYELSNGHPIYCAPTGRDGTGPNGLGFAVLDSDPAVKRAGVDTGLKLGKGTLRAPDVAVNFEGDEGTWASRAPLVVEYAGAGQDESELRLKIRELLVGGTRWIWVVRLTGAARVEVHEPGVPMQIVGLDQELTAPGVLALPVPVRALFERDAAHEATLRNLLAAQGYRNLEDVRAEGRQEGLQEGRQEGREEERAAARRALREAIAARGWRLDEGGGAQIEQCRESAQIARWIVRTVTAPSLAAVFAEGSE